MCSNNCGCTKKSGYRHIIQRLKTLKCILEAYANMPDPSIGSNATINEFTNSLGSLCGLGIDGLMLNALTGFDGSLFFSGSWALSHIVNSAGSNVNFANAMFCVPIPDYTNTTRCASSYVTLQTEALANPLNISTNWGVANLTAWASNLQVIIEFYEAMQ